ncbi:MAG: iron donor protein CyaY [Planctomycetes bacterium]|nr:iron donor protein CyaY [Planctomycetota bacterium]MCC7397493.1 iron donor protein CyaY [Planctomycetota bacterium]
MTNADPDYLRRAEACMQHLLAQLDHFDPDELEADLAQGVLKIAFADRRICVLNRQSAANQIWLAEGASAWHFEFDVVSRQWLDTKGRGELATILAKVISDRVGRRVTLSPTT